VWSTFMMFPLTCAFYNVLSCRFVQALRVGLSDLTWAPEAWLATCCYGCCWLLLAAAAGQQSAGPDSSPADAAGQLASPPVVDGLWWFAAGGQRAHLALLVALPMGPLAPQGMQCRLTVPVAVPHTTHHTPLLTSPLLPPRRPASWLKLSALRLPPRRRKCLPGPGKGEG